MSGDHKRIAVIFKAISESENEEKDPYCEKFTSSGFQSILIPVLEFEFVNLDKLYEKLNRFDDYAGIIFSSPRCVAGVEQAVCERNDRSILKKWNKHRHFVVGEKTAKLAESLGFVVEGKESGNAENLTKIITKDTYEKPFLYPTGSLTTNKFQIKLKDGNADADDIMIYKTKPHNQLEENVLKIKDLITKQNSIYFLYFSPSGVNFTLPILRKLDVDLNLIKFVSIGPTTEVGLINNGLKVAASAAKPNPESLLDAVLSINF